MPLRPDDIEEEHRQFASIISTFHQYGVYSIAANNRRRKDIYKLSRADQDLLASIGYKKKLAEVDNAIFANAEFLREVVADPAIFGHDGGESEYEQDTVSEGEDAVRESQDLEPPHGASHSDAHSHSHSHTAHDHGHSHADGHSHSHGSHATPGTKPSDADMEKLRSTIKQFVRDWSAEGKAERDLCYEPMKEALLSHFAHVPPEDRINLRVLVPGAGLCRLAWDIAYLGFSCQGNEFSHFMLLGSYFMLNRTTEVNSHVICPYIHSFSNIRNSEGLLRAISLPDVSPASLPDGSNFSLVAGDFEDIYGPDEYDGDEPQAGLWDAIVTCFFIDTAKNIVNYLRVIHRKLAPGGVWINLGPLLWHWENNSSNEPSIELSLEEVKELGRKIGFEISNEKTIETTYTNNSQSMLGYIYQAQFWTATKITTAT